MSKYEQVKKVKSNLKKRNYKAFIFFLAFTLLIWVFVQMSKTYEDEIQISVKLEEIPQHIVVEEQTKNISIEVNQTGFKILSVNLFNSSFKLNFYELDSLNGHLVFNLKKNKTKLGKELRLSSNEMTFVKDSIKFSYYKLSTKKLKVQPDFKISFNKGYDSVKPFSFEPSYIEVTGNDSILKDLDYISTEEKVFKEISDTLIGTIKLKKIDSLSINYVTKTVNYTLPVAKFTEKSFEIPIEVKSDLKGKEFVIFPKTVKVNFKTTLSNYEKIDESGFRVVAEYKPDEDFMLLELVKKPKQVKNVSLDNYKVDYLIKND